MCASQIISDYESLSNLTGQMREAAVQGDWDHLLEMEAQCKQHVAHMRLLEDDESLDEATRKLKVSFIHSILANDAEIRQHTEVWMQQLQRILYNNHQENRLQQAYQSDH